MLYFQHISFVTFKSKTAIVNMLLRLDLMLSICALLSVIVANCILFLAISF